jgi:hypothetical protein
LIAEGKNTKYEEVTKGSSLCLIESAAEEEIPKQSLYDGKDPFLH